MKKSLSGIVLVLILSGFASKSNAQIVIGNADMPQTSDTFRLSSGMINPQLDVVSTGANYTWDFSTLSPLIQRIDSFVSPLTTNLTYAIYFGFSANLAYKVYTPDSLGPIKPTDAFNFYSNTSASFKQIGYASFINATPLPIKFDTSDIIYKFPLNYAQSDSGRSSYKIDIPNLIYYGHSQKRVNEVDGWGTLKTPFGTFPVLRVKSVVIGRDTLAYNGLPGFAINRPMAVEYKWLGQGKGVPLLQVNTSVNLGLPVISSILYRDSARVGVPVLGLKENHAILKGEVQVFPNPSSKECTISYALLKSAEIAIEITDLTGKTMKSIIKTQQMPGNYTFQQNLSDIPSGTYLLNFYADKNIISAQKLLVIH